MLAVLCPGQGAQTPGFLTPWLELPAFSAALARLSTRAFFDLAETGSRPDADVVDTAVAQPLIVAAGLASGALLGTLPPGTVAVGHSVGEITAGGVAGCFSHAAAVDIARERGRLMAAASAAEPSGMVAILGGDADDVAAAVAAAECWIANNNGPGQLVAAGRRDALEQLLASPPAGSRMRPLAVAGGFHTPLMDSARTGLTDFTTSVPVRTPTIGIVANGDGAVVDDAGDFLARLVQQLTQPVRFDLCIQTLRDLGVSAVIELAPAGVLTGVIRRQLPAVTSVALRSPDDLDDARALIAEHTSIGERFTEDWQLLVAPTTGTIHLAEAPVVRNRSGEVPVQAGDTHDVIEWLVHDGDPVAEGQPLARLQAST